MQLDSDGKPMNPVFYVIKCIYYEYCNVLTIPLRVNYSIQIMSCRIPARHWMLRRRCDILFTRVTFRQTVQRTVESWLRSVIGDGMLLS